MNSSRQNNSIDCHFGLFEIFQVCEECVSPCTFIFVEQMRLLFQKNKRALPCYWYKIRDIELDE